MQDRSLIFSSVVMILCSIPVAGCASAREGTEIQISNRREQRELFRALDAEDSCVHDSNVTLKMNSRGASWGSYEMRVHNGGGTAIFINLIDVGGVYTAIYPYIALRFRRLNDEAWRIVEVNPAAYLAGGLRRIAVKPGEFIFFDVQLKGYIPSGAGRAKLELRFEIGLDNGLAAKCVLSDELMVT